jgi:hypothetical protein
VRFHLLTSIRLRSSPETFPYVVVECDHIPRQAHTVAMIAVCGAGMCVREDGLELALQLLLMICYIQCTYRSIPVTATTHGIQSRVK